MLGTTAATFMAQSLRCARCHDHKFEQFTQRDYMRMLAVFEPLKRPQEGRTDLDRMVGTEAELAVYQTATKAVDDQMALAVQRARSGRMGAEQTPGLGRHAADARDARRRGHVAEQPQKWRYTEERPADGWEQPTFDAGSWKEGPGGFGAEGTPGAVVERPGNRTTSGCAANSKSAPKHWHRSIVRGYDSCCIMTTPARCISTACW